MAFLLLNLFDLFLTGYIFSHKGSEANGLAAFILDHFGRYGKEAFAIYKFFMVVFIIFICEVIASKSTFKARIIMILGITIYFGVVLYECDLIYNYISIPMSRQDAGMLSMLSSLAGQFS